MGQLQLDFRAAQKLVPLDSEALNRARNHFKRIKQGAPGWEQNAKDVVEIAHTQAMHCVEQAGRDALMNAFAGKVARLRPAASASPHRAYGFTKMARQCNPALFKQSVVELMQLAPLDFRGSEDLRTLTLELSHFFAILEEDGANVMLMQCLKPIGERYRAMSKAAKERAQHAAIAPLVTAITEKLKPLVGDAEALRIATEAGQRVRAEIGSDKRPYEITSAVDKWMWGCAVTSRSKRCPVAQEDVEGPIEAYLNNADREIKDFARAFEAVLDEAFDAFSDDSPEVKDFELLMDKMEAVACEVADEIRPPQASDLQRQANEAWGTLEERVFAQACKIGESAAVKMIDDQRAHSVHDLRLPDDEKRWQFQVRVDRFDRHVVEEIDRFVQGEAHQWKSRFADHATPDTARLCERAKWKADTARTVKQFEIIDALRKAAQNPPPRPPVHRPTRPIPAPHRRRHYP